MSIIIVPVQFVHNDTKLKTTTHVIINYLEIEMRAYCC